METKKSCDAADAEDAGLDDILGCHGGESQITAARRLREALEMFKDDSQKLRAERSLVREILNALPFESVEAAARRVMKM